MTLPTLANPSTTVLHTEIYRVTTGGWLTFMFYPPEGYAVVWVAPYFASDYAGYDAFEYSFYVDTQRTVTVGQNGCSVVDEQVTSRFDLTVTGPDTTPLTYSFTRAEWAAQAAAFFAANPDYDGLGGAIADVPQLFPPGLLAQVEVPASATDPGAGYVYVPGSKATVPVLYYSEDWFQIPVYPRTGDARNDINAVALTGVDVPGLAEGLTFPEYSPVQLAAPVCNQGGTIDVFQAAYVDVEGVDVGPNGICGGNSPDQFGLLLNEPNVPLGTLVLRSIAGPVPPDVPPLTLSVGATGVQYSSIGPVNVAGWAGFRYLKLLARVTGFSSGQPLPRILLGIAPLNLLTQAVCAAALSGAPTLGLWYEVVVTEQGAAGQALTVDLALPIAGSGVWSNYSNQAGAQYAVAFTPQYPLGTGMFPIRPETVCPPVANNTVTVDGVQYIANGEADCAALVVCLDAGEAVPESN